MALPQLPKAGAAKADIVATARSVPGGDTLVSNGILVAINQQLHHSLDQQRTLTDGLQNVLFSTDVATLFLDRRLRVRYFTPATTMLFDVTERDIGRPLAKIASLAVDAALSGDAHKVIRTLQPIEREIEAHTGAWYMRRIMPYRARGDGIEGVVITFVDITERRQILEALEIAKREAQTANIAKSRFLAAASHDLRQPLQTLTLLHGLLAKTVTSDAAVRLVARLDETLGAMSGMLNALLDINRIEAGNVHAEKIDLNVGELLDRLKAEFDYIARAKGVELRVVPSGLRVHSDPALLDQIVRNLLSNALKYTKHGKVLIGCRRAHAHVRLEIWDTGVGIPETELQAIFEEYHQLDNAARERSRGLGLGLSIVKRLAALLRHPISVRSVAGRGSVFAVTLDLPPDHGRLPAAVAQATTPATTAIGRSGTILVVDDDPEILDLLDLVLTDAGHRAITAVDGVAALARVARDAVGPDLVLVDYNLPGKLDGLQLIAALRARAGQPVPAIVLTGDISTLTLRDIAAQRCTQLSKPVKPEALLQAIEALLALPLSAATPDGTDARTRHDDAAVLFARLTVRQRQVLALVLAGQPNKNIAADLGISQRTVEAHRAAIMTRTGSASLPDLVRLALV
jgi:two-component system CheB/CheR fusion protein